MNYEERVIMARTELAESGEAFFLLADATDGDEIRHLIVDIAGGAGRHHVLMDLHNDDTLHFMTPSFTTRVWEQARRRWRMAKLN